MSEAMVEVLDQVIAILLPAVATLLAGWLAVVGNKIKALYTEKVMQQYHMFNKFTKLLMEKQNYKKLLKEQV